MACRRSKLIYTRQKKTVLTWGCLLIEGTTRVNGETTLSPRYTDEYLEQEPRACDEKTVRQTTRIQQTCRTGSSAVGSNQLGMFESFTTG